MTDVSVKMGVTGLSQFKQGMSQAQANVKSMDAALKLNEKQLKATGDAETYMQQKTTLLTQKLQAQKAEIANADGALRKMKEQGVDPLSKAYQDMQTKMLEAHAAMLDTQQELQNVGTASSNAAKQTDSLTSSLAGISKKMSLDQVMDGIDRITGGMEAAAKKAIELGQSIWDNIVDSAGYADDIATLASKLGLSTTEVQQMQYVAGQFEASAEDIGKAWKRVKRDMASDNKEVVAMFKDLGIATKTGMTEMNGFVNRNRDYKDVFWEIGEALMQMPDEIKREEYATQLLGKSWDDFVPLFKAGRKAYEEAMNAAPAATEKAVENAADLNDKINQLEQSWETLKLEVIGGLAPALSKAADSLKGLIDSVTEYLQTDKGQAQLQRMSEALSGIFDSLLNFDPDKVISGVATVLDGITKSFEWIDENWEGVQNGLLMIAGAFGVMKLTTLGISIANLVSAWKTHAAGAAAGAGAQQPTGTPVVAPTGGQQDGNRYSPTAPVTDTVTLDPVMTQIGASAFAYQEYARITAAGKTYDEVMDEVLKMYGLSRSNEAVGIFLDANPFNLDNGNLQEYVENITPQIELLAKKIEEGADVFSIMNELMENNGKLKDMEPPELELEPVIPETAQQDIQGQLDELTTTVNVIPILGGMGDGKTNQVREYANGLPYVPFDGYMAMLHKGERVVPAREAGSSRSYSSNLYVESMIMNNGTDAEGLAAAMAAAQRRVTNGYGS